MMDPAASQNNAEPDERISELVGEFFDRRQAGEEITPEQFVAEHAEVGSELRSALEGLPLVEQACLSADDEERADTTRELPEVEGFKLIEEIGRGGMGVVYRAEQVSTKRIVALKVMLAGPFASPSARRRFEREVQLAARLQHAHIVRVLESGHVAEQQYYAMDYVPGLRLDRHLSTTKPGLRTIVGLFVQLCEAVEYAHGHGVVHRDLKPANVLIDDEGAPHILDFGLAKATDPIDSKGSATTDVSLPGQVLGTLAYLSPEQAAGRPDQIDPRTDVYTLGVMLFEAATGSLPFDTSGRPSQVIERILEDAPAAPRALCNRVDAELETIILKALEKDKSRRYQSAKELGEDLRRYVAGEPILARRPSSLYILRKKMVKHRLAVAVAGVALGLSLVALAAGIWWRWHDLAQARRLALAIQSDLERGAVSVSTGRAETLHERYPDLAEARLVWAQAQFRQEDRRRGAIRFLEQQIRDDSSRWACRALLAETYRAARGEAERAKALEDQAERDMPDSAEAWYVRSFATLDEQTALRCAEEAVQRQPEHVLAWERRAHLCLQTGHLDDALQAADRLIDLGHDFGGWAFFKGHVFAAQGRFREAIAQYTNVIAADPEGSERAYRYRAHAHRRVGEYEEAVADYTKALAVVDKPVYQCFYQRATALWILGRPEEAIEDYRRVRPMLGRPFYSDARQCLILHEQGRTDEAAEVLEAALRDTQDHWLRQIFRCLAGRLTPDQLVADGRARDNREQLCEAYYYAGEACLLADRPADARRCFERCVQTGVQFDPDTSPVIPMNEFELAQWRLETLPAGPPTSQP